MMALFDFLLFLSGFSKTLSITNDTHIRSNHPEVESGEAITVLALYRFRDASQLLSDEICSSLGHVTMNGACRLPFFLNNLRHLFRFSEIPTRFASLR